MFTFLVTQSLRNRVLVLAIAVIMMGYGAFTAMRLPVDVFHGLGQAIGGLYAVGNDMHSIMGGTYPAPGITIGPGLVFGCLAARHAGARSQGKPGF